MRHDHCDDHCKHHVHPEHNRFAPECDDQLPAFSAMGRGPKGDSYRVKLVDPDTHEVTQLVGETYDETTKTWHTEWMSENINGGFLEYQYHLRPYNVPATFTITFKYHRPSAHGYTSNEQGAKAQTSRTHDTHGAFCGDGLPNSSDLENNVGDDPGNECSWVWTTPAIPYVWTTQGTDEIVGSGTGTVFTMTMHDLDGNPVNPNVASNWTERLRYPKGWTREQFNAPEVFDPWVSNLKFGWGGDIAVPDFYDISKIIGVSINNIKNLLNGQPGQICGSDNVVDYVNDEIERLSNHIHKDLGFPNQLIADNPSAKVPNSNNPATIENYIKAAKTEVKAGTDIWVRPVEGEHGANGQTIYTVGTDLRNDLNAMKNELNDAIQDVAGDMPSVAGGAGINVTKEGNVYVVTNTMAGGSTQLRPGTDYTYKMFNGWQSLVDVTGVMGSKNNPTGPEVYVNLSTNGNKITGGTIQFDFYNQVRLVHPEQMDEGSGSPANPVKFSHGSSLDSYGLHAAICGITFAGNKYSALNDMYIVTQSTTCLWNLSAMNSNDSCAWPVFVELRKASNPSSYGGCRFVLYATMIGDGYNSQLKNTCSKWLGGDNCHVPTTSRANTRCAGLFSKTGSTTNIV